MSYLKGKELDMKASKAAALLDKAYVQVAVNSQLLAGNIANADYIMGINSEVDLDARRKVAELMNHTRTIQSAVDLEKDSSDVMGYDNKSSKAQIQDKLQQMTSAQRTQFLDSVIDINSMATTLMGYDKKLTRSDIEQRLNQMSIIERKGVQLGLQSSDEASIKDAILNKLDSLRINKALTEKELDKIIKSASADIITRIIGSNLLLSTRLTKPPGTPLLPPTSLTPTKPPSSSSSSTAVVTTGPAAFVPPPVFVPPPAIATIPTATSTASGAADYNNASIILQSGQTKYDPAQVYTINEYRSNVNVWKANYDLISFPALFCVNQSTSKEDYKKLFDDANKQVYDYKVSNGKWPASRKSVAVSSGPTTTPSLLRPGAKNTANPTTATSATSATLATRPNPFVLSQGIKKIPFGNLFIDAKKLKKNNLSVTYKNGQKVAGIRNTMISENLKKVFTKKKINTKKVVLSEMEKLFLQQLVHKSDAEITLSKSNLIKGMGMTNVTDLKKQLNILMGERDCGNNSPKIVQEIQQVIQQLLYLGKITNKQAKAFMAEL